jgi:1-deoxy-D-xylulose-5-phosphate reductoisomerase
MKKVVVLGSTGSIGQQALDVVRRFPGEFEVVGLSAGGARDESRRQFFADVDEFMAGNTNRAVLESEQGLEAVCLLAQSECDVVVNSIAGAVGLKPTIAALSSRFSPKLALANKESLVAGGQLIKNLLSENLLARINPVDSEHSAIWQALGNPREVKTTAIRRLILTASGGPFRGFSRAQLRNVSVHDALKHPTWNMGQLVSINSATMMNKALELIEAVYLFGVDESKVEVVVHPQSKVHSMVEFADGSIIAQASNNDMRLPIALGLSCPARLDGVIGAYDFASASNWQFEPLDESVFHAIKLARSVLNAGPQFPAVMNAANEVAVGAFVEGKIGFLQIMEVIEEVIARFDAGDTAFCASELEGVLRIIKWSEEESGRVIRSISQ